LQAATHEPLVTGGEVSLEPALWAYTMGGAVAQGDEDNRGSLDIGKWADFALLEGDLRDPYSLSVQQTILGGKDSP
jgi:predicted amidohydrolase YtcJ